MKNEFIADKMSISKALTVSLQHHSIIYFQNIHMLSDPLISIGKVMIDYAPKYLKELNRIWKWGILVEPISRLYD